MASVVKLWCRLRFSVQVTCSYSVRRLCQGASKDGAWLAGNSDLKNVGRSDDEDSAKIIQLLNTASVKDLASLKHVSTNMATTIVSHREGNGPFVGVGELLKLPGIGRQTLQRICKGILRPPLQVDVGRGDGSTGNLQQAGLSASQMESLKDIVAVDVGLRHLSWVYMTRDRQVWQWRVKDITEIKAGKWDPSAYHKMVTDTIAEMPNPDLYVLEHQPYINANKATYQMVLFQRTLQSMLFTALNRDRGETGTLHAVSMLHTQVGRHFGLQVRGTRMSGQDVVAKILREEAKRADEHDDEDLPARLSWENADMFQAATKHEKEHLANCLLQAITFYDLVVDKAETDRAESP